MLTKHDKNDAGDATFTHNDSNDISGSSINLPADPTKLARHP